MAYEIGLYEKCLKLICYGTKNSLTVPIVGVYPEPFMGLLNKTSWGPQAIPGKLLFHCSIFLPEVKTDKKKKVVQGLEI